MQASTSSFVTFENIQKTYDGETLVIKDMNLDIAKGEFVTMLGPSGSGKSTSLMLLAGFEQPTSGNIYLDGKRLNDVPAYERNIGIVFQNYALFPHMTVLENVAFPLRMRKVNKAEMKERAQKALDMVRLGQFGNRFPKQLSGGQQQRVALARALVFEPSLVLMDEPLGALDKKLREEMQIEIKHIHENLGVTVVFVTHDQDEALTMSDRVAVFNDGRIQQIDAPARLYEKPANSFVANFIGETNMLAAKLEQVGSEDALVRLSDGTALRANLASNAAIGTDVDISVRPERIAIIDQADQTRNTLPATILETIYHGAHGDVVLKTAAGDQMKVTLRAGEMTPDHVEAGREVFVAFSPDDTRALVR